MTIIANDPEHDEYVHRTTIAELLNWLDGGEVTDDEEFKLKQSLEYILLWVTGYFEDYDENDICHNAACLAWDTFRAYRIKAVGIVPDSAKAIAKCMADLANAMLKAEDAKTWDLDTLSALTKIKRSAPEYVYGAAD